VKLWNDYFHGTYLAVRPYVFSKLFLCMVALDTWMLMIGHAGRYGVAGFNVAHFALLGRATPLPTPAHYIATLLLTGLLALTLALLGARKLPMGLLFLLYTYSWSMSMLDSYQHHYFVSLVLLCMVFFPTATLAPERAAVTRGFGYPLLAATISLLYTFTSIAKMDAQWCNGFTLRRISSAEQVLAPLVRLAAQLGVSEASFWSIASTSVIPLELLIAIGYGLCARQDDDPTRRRWSRSFVALTFPIAVALHLGAEALRLDIGWFSYYMLALACTFLLPGRALQVVSLAIMRPAQAIAKFLAEANPDKAPSQLETWLTCAAVSGVLAAAAFLLDLPGAAAAAVLAALGLWSYAIALSVRKGKRKRPDTQVVHVALALGVAAVLMWSAISVTEVRWDYYRYLGGDLQRRGESQAALAAYLKGERYAPKGSSRRSKIRQLQRELGLQTSP
jgi:hypothetical protein